MEQYRGKKLLCMCTIIVFKEGANNAFPLKGIIDLDTPKPSKPLNKPISIFSPELIHGCSLEIMVPWFEVCSLMLYSKDNEPRKEGSNINLRAHLVS